jgi:hypothetical protein
MANYSLVINSQFKPFSYQEMLAPTLMATQAHQELENQYGELATKASVWEEMANEQTDPYAYKMYKTYANDLEAQAGQLAREGLNAASRRDMLNMKARYSKEITPIEQAYATRQKQAEQQQQALLQDPTLMLSRRASTTSLDDYIRNPQLAYEAYSGKLITAQAAQAASALAKEMQEKPRKWRSILGNSYYESMMQKGFSSKAVLQAIQDNPNAAPQLTRIVEDAINSSGVRNWGDQATIARAIDYAKQGLWSAVGETQYQTLDNWRAKMAEQEAMQKRAEQRAAARAQQDKGFELNPSNIYSSRELNASEKKYKDVLKRYSKYFYKDANGRIRMTWEGWQEYNRKVRSNSGKPMVTPEGTTILTSASTTYSKSPFRTFMDSIGAKNVKGWQPGNLGNVWGRYITDNPAAKTAKFDAMKTAEYIYDVDQSPEYQRNYKSKLSRVIDDTEKFIEVDYDSKSNKWKDTGKTLSFANFDTDDYTIVARAPSEIGTTLLIKKKGEKAKRYLAPPGVNTTMEGGRDQAISEMLITRRMLQNPKLTSQQRRKLENHYDNLTQQQIMFESGLDLTNTTKTQEFPNYYIP